MMVDVSVKRPTLRRAQVACVIHLSPEAFDAVRRHTLSKGDVWTVAQLAGIQAAKRTAELIPLCHPLPLDHVAVSFEPDPSTDTIRILAQTSTTAKTGIEMEAFVAATIASLTLYDMVKALDPRATITDVHLVSKTGGKQGVSGVSSELGDSVRPEATASARSCEPDRASCLSTEAAGGGPKQHSADRSSPSRREKSS